MVLKKKPKPNLMIRLHGGGVLPENVPVSVMSELIAQVQTLATGGDGDKNALRLVDIKRRSAGYMCLAEKEELVLQNLEISGNASQEPTLLQFHMVTVFEELSRIAARFDCVVEVAMGEKKLLEVRADTFSKLKGNALIRDEASVSGELMRVGGATERRCTIRIPGRKKLLFCSVASDEIGRKLGRHLYEEVTLKGSAVYFAKTWQIVRLVVTDVIIKKKGTFDQFVAESRAAGADAWDAIDDVDKVLRSIR